MIATRVVPAAVDRLVWSTDAHRIAPRSRAGAVDPRPIARSTRCTLHLALDEERRQSYVLRGAPASLSSYERDLGHLRAHRQLGLELPSPRRLAPDELWLDSIPWPHHPPRPAASAVEQYVANVIAVATRDGLLVGTGTPLVRLDGRVVCVDVCIAGVLEPDQRAALAAVWRNLVLLDTAGICGAVSRLCGSRPIGLADAAQRAVLSLVAEWTPVSLGLSLHHVASASVSAGPRSEPLVLLADELLHRLDLAHDSRVHVEQLATPSAALRLSAPLTVPA